MLTQVQSTLEISVSNVQSVPETQLRKPATSIVLIKTHKTGGTTLASILNRFGYKHRVSFLFNKGDPKHGHFRLSNLAKQNGRNFLPPLCVANGDYKNYRNYSIMTAHLRFLPNAYELQRYMRPDAKTISILREPSAQWESAFSFFGASRVMHISNVTRGGTREADIATFLSDPELYWKKAKGGTAKHYTRNGQMFDFIADNEIHTNNKTVDYVIKRLDVKLDLVLIMEYFDESLVLLKNLMNWEFRDIMYVTKNERAKHSSLTDAQREEIRKWNAADVKLYDHFNKTLWRKISEYGGAFQEDLRTFRKLLKENHRACVIDAQAKARKGQKLLRVAHVTANNSVFCKRLVSENYETVKLIMTRQRPGRRCDVKWNKVLTGRR